MGDIGSMTIVTSWASGFRAGDRSGVSDTLYQAQLSRQWHLLTNIPPFDTNRDIGSRHKTWGNWAHDDLTFHMRLVSPSPPSLNKQSHLIPALHSVLI